MKNTIRRGLGVLSAAALTVPGMVALAGSASAATTVQCGEIVNQSITLANDLSNCTTNGLIITANNITVDLNGHTIDGDNSPVGSRAPEIVGIRLRSVRNVTVKNGTVKQFETGVYIKGGSNNTITALRVIDNINKLRENLPSGAEAACELGDGITTLDSNDNVITDNQVIHNGPYSGISLVGNSDRNKVNRNQVANNNIPNIRANGTTGPCGAPFSRPNQDIGIRIEGPGADENVVATNFVSNNQLYGISIHGYVCHPPSGAPSEPNNAQNVIRGNTVQHNGWATPNETGDGIAILEQGPSSIVCVAFNNSILENTVVDSAQHGIFLGPRGSHNNTVNNNIADRNGFGCTDPIIDPDFGPSCLPGDGIHVEGGYQATCGVDLVNPCPGSINNELHRNEGHGNARYDGFDGNPNCDNNDWVANQFGTVNQPCVAANGGTGTVPDSAASAARAAKAVSAFRA